VQHLKERLNKIDFTGEIHLSGKGSKTDMIVVEHGDLVISGINIAKGAVAVYQGENPITATIHYSSYQFDKDQIDIEYFKKKMISALKIPFSRVGIGDGDQGDERSLSQISPEFAKAVQHIQREVAIGLKKVAIVHLALSGFNAEDLRDFDIIMTASSAIDELYRIETWQSRANVIDALRGTEMFPKRWILKRFTDMTDDEIDEMDEEMKKAQADAIPELGMGMGGFGGLGPPGAGLPPGELGEPGEPIPVGGEMLEMPGAIPGSPGVAPPSVGPQLPEGYNSGLEEMLLTELKESNRRNVIIESFKKPVRFNSCFEHLLNNCELDGLSSDPLEKDPDQVLVESIRFKEDTMAVAEEAIERTKMLLEQEDDILDLESDEITLDDLPSRMVLVE